MTRTALTIAATLVAISGHARAGGYAVGEQGAVAGATAGAGTARTDDASAAWYNPAALADGGGLRVAVGLMAAMPKVTANAMDDSWQFETERRLATPPHVFASLARGDFAYGLTFNVPYGSGVTWPEAWEGRFEILLTRLEVFRLAPFVAWTRGKLSIAGGLHVDAGRLRLARKLDFIDTEGDVFIDMDGVGVGAHAAALYRATDALALGLTYKSRTRLHLSGGADFTAPDAFDMRAADQRVSTELGVPDRIAGGVRWRSGDLSVLGDLEVTLWSINDRTVLDFEQDITTDVVQTNNWRSTVTVRAGAEYAASPAVTARAGLYYDPSPARDERLAPSSPDSSRIGATVGAGYALSTGWAVDAFYEYLHLRSREAANEDALAARYQGRAHILGLGVQYRR